MDELDLVERARAGDARAFAALARSHERTLYATALGIMRSQWDASDAMQDALTEAFAKITTLRDPTRFDAWLSRILVNKCRMMMRKRKHDVLTAEPPEPSAAGGGVLDPQAYVFTGPEDGMDLMLAIQALDLDHREVIVLRFFRDMKVADIAALLGCPVGTVKSRINRALERLSRSLGPVSTEEVER